MKYSVRLLRSLGILTPCLAMVGAAAVGCSSDDRRFEGAAGAKPGGSGGSPGPSHMGGMGSSAGLTGTGGMPATGGAPATGGNPPVGQGGRTGESGAGAGGVLSSGGRAGSGGRTGAGGRPGNGGSGGSAAGAGGKAGSGGSAGSSSGGAPPTSDACAMTTPLTGGTTVKTSNQTGKAAGLDWSLWSNGSGGSITTYSIPAFSAAWANSGDFLARLGLQWNATKTYDQYGTITAQFAYTKTGTGGGYSYIGMYGWSVSPCVEWYIVDDSYGRMPVNPGSTTNKGTVEIDGGKYTLYTRPTTGTGGSKCSGTTSWQQFYSVRQTARQCGDISVTKHFDAWAAAGMTLGKMDQAQILIEVGGGTGSIDFTVANVVAQ